MSLGTGVLGPGGCLEQGLSAATDLLASTDRLFDVNQFVNPQAQNIVDMLSASSGARYRAFYFRQYLESIEPPPPNLTALLGEVDQFMAVTHDFNSAVDQYKVLTNFLSGKSTVFPAFVTGGFDPTFLFAHGPAIPPEKLALLAGFGFVGLWGMVKGGNHAAYARCEVDPNDPCARVNKILGAVIGLFNTAINAMIDGLNQMLDFADKIMEYVAKVLGFVENLVAIVLEAISELINMLLKAIRGGLAGLLNSLKLDPCLASVLQNCCGPALKTALSI